MPEHTVEEHYVVGGWQLALLSVNGLPTLRITDEDIRPGIVRVALGRTDLEALHRIADEAGRLLDAKGGDWPSRR